MIQGDNRIAPLLMNMNKQYLGRDFTKGGHSGEKLTTDQVNTAAEFNMPLCMKVIAMIL